MLSGRGRWRHALLIEHLRGANPVPTYCAARTERYLFAAYDTGERGSTTCPSIRTSCGTCGDAGGSRDRLEGTLRGLCDPHRRASSSTRAWARRCSAWGSSWSPRSWPADRDRVARARRVASGPHGRGHLPAVRDPTGDRRRRRRLPVHHVRRDVELRPMHGVRRAIPYAPRDARLDVPRAGRLTDGTVGGSHARVCRCRCSWALLLVGGVVALALALGGDDAAAPASPSTPAPIEDPADRSARTSWTCSCSASTPSAVRRGARGRRGSARGGGRPGARRRGHGRRRGDRVVPAGRRGRRGHPGRDRRAARRAERGRLVLSRPSGAG